ncbi:hypothetical protein GH714_034510 [Hevea brasiliensis]|uniref:Uncharacterized protein n=1 Tax=Hevea brasiliensis TaxID=3981 RepID=A0A6A6NCP5_HEVBR|nr:hypothetical protein GH714_034510 [Hevea brasiliensis]
MESLLTSFISPIWDVIKGLWNCIPSRVGYFSDLQSNVDSLKQGKKRLLILKEEVEARVTREENQLKQRTYKVRDWLSRVECMLKSVDEITDEGEEEIKKKCIRCFFPKNFCSYQEVGKKVRSELEALTQLINEGHFDAVTEIKPHDPVDERPTERIIGLESEFNQVWKCMEDRSVRTIGIYGLGGVDDLWDHLDLLIIGIPPLDRTSGSKVVFTTRSQEVCGFMKADKSIKVECLVPEEALQLFQMKLSQGTLNAHRDIPKLAVMLAECCQGLPLALITVGRAMASRRNLKDWKHALKMLQSYPSEFSGMAKDVFPIFKFSYDSLSNDTLRSCFLYCSLFPEDYNIGKDELTELWIREGFLHNFNDIYDARNEGEYIIGSLKHAGLLEEGPTPEDYVRMHDVIRDMALWIASNHEIKIAVVEDAASIKTHGFEDRNDVKRLTLWGKSFKDLNETQHFPCLVTFLVRDTKLISFPCGFFQHMRVLNILDLSRNWNLSELPTGISVLTNLQHLNLSYTRINSLPHEVQYLRNLKSLIMDYTYKLAYIPREVISSLSLLQVFSKMQEVHNKLFDERGLLEELERLKDMEDMSVVLTSLDSVEKFFCSPKLESCIRRLWVSMCKDLTSFQISSLRRGAKHLERLEIYRCPLLKEFIVHSDESEMIQGCVPTNIGMGQESFQELRYLKVDKCPGIKDLTLVIYAPNLQTIILDACSSIVEIIADDKLNRWRAEIKENPEVFPNLATLILIRLPKLKSICQQTLGFPSLKILKVVDCPSLKKLPFDSNSAKNTLQAIEAAEDWWNSLQWEEDAKIAFASRFRCCISQDEIEVAKMEAIKLIPELMTKLTAAHMDLESKNANAQKITNEETREVTSAMMKKMPELLMQVTDPEFMLRSPEMIDVMKELPELMTVGAGQESRDTDIQQLLKGLIMNAVTELMGKEKDIPQEKAELLKKMEMMAMEGIVGGTSGEQKPVKACYTHKPRHIVDGAEIDSVVDAIHKGDLFADSDGEEKLFSFKVGLAQLMLRSGGGVVVEVTNTEEATIAEEAGAACCVFSGRLMLDLPIVRKIKRAVSIPVMVRIRAGHFVEAWILEAIGVDFVDESELLGNAFSRNYINKHYFRAPFAWEESSLEGTAENVRSIMQTTTDLARANEDEVSAFAEEMEVSYDLVAQIKEMGKLPVVQIAMGGIESPADAALMMQLGCDGVTALVIYGEENLLSAKVGFAQLMLLSGGRVIVEVTNAEEAKIAEEGGAACCVVHQGKRMPDLSIVRKIKQAVSIPVMVRIRVGHFVEAWILEAIGVDYIDESELMGYAANNNYINEVSTFAKEMDASDDLVAQIRDMGKLPVVQIAMGGVETPADAALMMHLGCDGVCIRSEIFEFEHAYSWNPSKRLPAIVKAVNHYNNPRVLAECSNTEEADDDTDDLV